MSCKEGHGGKLFKIKKEMKPIHVCFEDYEDGKAVPAAEDALKGIRADRSLPALFSSIKACLMSTIATGISIVNDLVTGGADKALSAEMGVALKGEIDQAEQKIEVLESEANILQSDITAIHTEVDQTQNEMTAVQGNLSSIQTEISGMKNSVVDDLTTGGADVPLSAGMGKELARQVSGEAQVRQDADEQLADRITQVSDELRPQSVDLLPTPGMTVVSNCYRVGNLVSCSGCFTFNDNLDPGGAYQIGILSVKPTALTYVSFANCDGLIYAGELDTNGNVKFLTYPSTGYTANTTYRFNWTYVCR